MIKTQVLVIGGGVTGTGLIRDLALRGVRCMLVEQEDLDAGASGANHGLLHSGARYVSNDPVNAAECCTEGRILKKTAAQCIEDSGGLFVAVEGDDEKYVADFPLLCDRSHIPVQPLDVRDVREMEPALSEKLIAAYAVPDASIDPFKLTRENYLHARALGCWLLRHTKVTGFTVRRNRICATQVTNTLSGEKWDIDADQVVNATGAWAGLVAGLAGISIPMIYFKGSLVVTHSRLTQKVINRLRPSSNADILVPGGTVSILGTTSVRIDHPDHVRPTVKELDFIVEEGAAMVPALETTRFIRAYAGVRPLVGPQDEDATNGRVLSRGFALLDHSADGLENFITITGGKLTTYRLMAEKTADLVCRRIGVSQPCVTRSSPLPADASTQWTQAGFTPKLWFDRLDPDDLLLCECEMVPTSVVDAIIASLQEQNIRPDLKAIGLRSRIGKGACQGIMCALRLAAYLYDRGDLQSDQGLPAIKEFLNERWRGVRPLLWDMPLIQSELREALYCGLCSLEL
jgi:glycerol-3-phosphate dehydrogenase